MKTLNFDPVEEVCGRIEFARRLYQADLEAMPDEMLGRGCGGKSRSPYDVTYELAGMYSSFSNLLASGSGNIERPQGWVTASEEFKDRKTASAALDSALSGFVTALKSYPGDPSKDEFASPVGMFTPIGMANLAVWHTMYHSGQLNYIQTIHGDDGFHWA